MNTPEYLLGIHNFKGRSEDELDISRGDYVEVLEDDSEFNDSWYLGHNLTTNAVGLFPKSFTAPVSSLPPEVQQRAAELEAYNREQEALEMEEEQDVELDFSETKPQRSTVYSGMSANNRHSFSLNNPAPTPQYSNLQHQPTQPQQHQHQQPHNANPQPISQQQQISNWYSGTHQQEIEPRSGTQPELSKLSINDDPQSPSTMRSSGAGSGSGSGSGPNSASSVDPSYDAGKQNNFTYPQQQPQISQASDIDAAISAMQSSPHQSSPHQPSPHQASPPPNPQLPPVLQTSQPVSREPSFSKGPVPGTVLQWTPQHVESYFISKGLTEDASKFVQHRVTGAILLEMDRETLKEIDILSFGPRFEIEKEIRYLRQVVGFAAPSPQSPGTPLTPQSYGAAAMMGSPSAGTSMSSVMNTPIASQGGYQGYFPPQPSHQQQQADNGLLNPSLTTQRSMQNLGSQSNVSSYSQNPGHSFQKGHAPAPPNQYPANRVPNQGRTSVPQQQQFTASQPMAISQQPSTQRYQQHNRSSSGGVFKLKQPGAAASEEEITGSLTSNFSLRHNAAAVAAAQAAESGHHRRSSSATSRYSVLPNVTQHQRTRTLDDWDNNLPPALEEGGPGASGTSPRGHRRSESRNSTYSASRKLGVAPQHEFPSSDTNSNSRKAFHSRASSTDSKKQKRRSSMLSLLSSGGSPKKTSQGASSIGSPSIGSPIGTPNSSQSSKDSMMNSSFNAGGARSSSDNGPSLKSIMRPSLGKQKTSAFQEGIQNVTAEQAAATAEKSGWMHKRGGSGLGVWSKRFFTLHGTRLSYFTNFKDTKERGLIDITGHKVVPVKDHELLVSLSAAGMGAGRYCFKLIPPGPGYKKGVAFTAPKIHYFAVESAEELRLWQSALMSATIERDESIPVESTCKLPTISLSKAQELMAERLKTKGDIGSLTR